MNELHTAAVLHTILAADSCHACIALHAIELTLSSCNKRASVQAAGGGGALHEIILTQTPPPLPKKETFYLSRFRLKIN